MDEKFLLSDGYIRGILVVSNYFEFLIKKHIMSSDFDNKPLQGSANNIYKNKLKFEIKNGYPLKSLVS